MLLCIFDYLTLIKKCSIELMNEIAISLKKISIDYHLCYVKISNIFHKLLLNNIIDMDVKKNKKKFKGNIKIISLLRNAVLRKGT